MTKFIDLSGVESFNTMPKQIMDRMKLLTERERKYFMTMWPKSGVMYITAKPGVAKSAIAKSIANKMGFDYKDVRLSMVDETDVGLYPSVNEVDVNGHKVKCLDFIVPRWAIESNSRPTIIHFEEMNRASQQVRNAALQILLERQIGTDFKFNDTVLMMSSGNLGEDDGTDVEEFDQALNNRLIHYSHTLSAAEWIDGFARENVHSSIVSYISSYPEKLYQPPTDNAKAYATPRSWTFLSDFIVKNFGMDSSPADFLPYLMEVSHGYIGGSAQRFIQYCQEMVNITINDIINNYDSIEKELQKYNRDKNSELINSLKEHNISKMTDVQIRNVNKFLGRVGQDEVTAYLLYLLDNVDTTEPRIKEFLRGHRDILIDIQRINKPGSK